MKRAIVTSLAVLGMWLATGLNQAGAQFILGQAPQRVRPTVSPSINVGAGGAYSYYGYVKPQGEANRNIMALQQNMDKLNPDGTLQGQLDQGKPRNALGGLQTGHPATFFNTSHYYPTAPIVGTMGPGWNAGMTLGGPGGPGYGLGGDYGLGYGYGVGGNFGGGDRAPRTFFSGDFNRDLRR